MRNYIRFIFPRANQRWEKISLFFIVMSLLLSCGNNEKEHQELNERENVSLETIQNPVLPGDFADPSVVRVGNEYWATATSSEWAPLFPLLKSTDLENWEIVDHVFPEDLPGWAEAHFWAPEIAFDNDTYYIYYTAKKNNGPLCVGVASSKNPQGPYRDHGAIVCQDAGAIDGFQIRDDKGKLYLIWKEDGNSRGEPTPMWGQEMNEKRTELIGEKFELFRNDPETWEGNLVEGAYLMKRDGYYYTFYSGDACCGRECTYGIGVARSKDLRGPWEKYEENPLKRENEEWKCAGHGSMVQDGNGRYYFLYHAYSKKGNVYTGRQGLLDEVVWREDGWPEFKQLDSIESRQANSERDLNFIDDFEDNELSERWQWPVGNKPIFTLENNSLSIQSKPERLGAILAQRTLSPDYEAVTAIERKNNSNSQAGIAAIGDENNALGISYSKREIILWKVQDGNEETIAKSEVLDSQLMYLKVEVKNGKEFSFFWSENGETWEGFEGVDSLNGYYLPPWDRAVRIGLFHNGEPGTYAVFDFFNLKAN